MTDELRTRGILCSASFMPSWVKPVSADPRASVAEMRERAALGRSLSEQAEHEIEAQGYSIYQVVRELNERFGTPSYTPRPDGLEAPPCWGHWSWKEATVMIATALGAPEPPWDETTHSWWFNKNHGLFDWVRTPADVARIRVPDWGKTPQVGAMLEAQARWREAFPGDPAPFDMLYPLSIPGNRWMIAAGYPSFIDTGICLLGIANFLAVLASDRSLADALADKCFELITSYGDFLLSMAGMEVEGWMGFGGDVSAMLSPRFYERYGNGFDARLFEYVKDVTAQPMTPRVELALMRPIGPSVRRLGTASPPNEHRGDADAPDTRTGREAARRPADDAPRPDRAPRPLRLRLRQPGSRQPDDPADRKRCRML